MKVALAIVREVASMFFGTPRLAVPLLLIIAVSGALARFFNAQAAGGALLIGCLVVLAENVLHEARRGGR